MRSGMDAMGREGKKEGKRGIKWIVEILISILQTATKDFISFPN